MSFFRIKHRFNIIPLAVLIIINIIQVLYVMCIYDRYALTIVSTNMENTIINPYFPVFSSFTLWIGGNHTSIFSKIFYLFPFIVPFSHRYETEIDLSFKKYASNYSTAFLASGLTISLPLVCNFMTIMLFYSVIPPDSVYDIYYGVFSNSFMGELFYTKPFFYIAIFLALNHIFYGLLGGLCYTLYQLTKRKIFSVCIPPLFPLVIHFVESFQKGVVMENNQELSPMIYLNPACSRHTSWLIITTEYSILFLITIILFIITLKLHKKRERGA